MAEDRLHVLDVHVSVDAAPTTNSYLTFAINHHMAICNQSRVLALANGRFVDLYCVCANNDHPFSFQHHISIAEHLKCIHASISNPMEKSEIEIVRVTCVTFPIPGFLLVGIFVKHPKGQPLNDQENDTAMYLLGFWLYATSVTRFSCDKKDDDSLLAANAIQVALSFADFVVEGDGEKIQSLHPFRQDLTPDAGAVLILFSDSNRFGVFSWKERLSDRQVCLAHVKQHAEKFTSAVCTHDGQYLVLGDEAGRLVLLDFHAFFQNINDTVERSKQSGGKRLGLGPCFRSSVIVRDNPLDHVRVVQTVASSGRGCACTSLQSWSWDGQDEQKHFVLAGQQDGAFRIFELVQGTDQARQPNALQCIQMYPGLASGTHDAVRWISKPFPRAKEKGKAVEFVVISDMRWRVWRVEVAGFDVGSNKQRRYVWPTVRQSLALPSYSLAIPNLQTIVLLPRLSALSHLMAQALATASSDYASHYPIGLIITANRLQIIGVLTREEAETNDGFSESPSHVCDEKDVDTTAGHEAEHVNAPILDRSKDKAYDVLTPMTIQDKYRLPSTERKTKTAIIDKTEANADHLPLANGIPKVADSKTSRVEYTERMASAMHRIETLNGLLTSMRTSFQLFSTDVQHHMNDVSNELEKLRWHHVTRETAHKSTE